MTGLAGPAPPRFDVVGVGFSSLDTVGLVPHLPRLDEGAPLLGLARQGGGPVAQALVTLARLGASTGYVGHAGDDDAGRQMRADLTAEGVDTAHFTLAPGKTSPQCIILVHQPTGKRSSCCIGGDAGPIPVPLDDAFVTSGRWLHLDGVAPAAARAAAVAARAAGIPVCLDAGGSGPHLTGLVPLTTVLIAAETFVTAAVPDAAPGVAGVAGDRSSAAALEAGAAALLAQGPRVVVVTCGERGAYTLSAAEAFWTPAFTVPVVDTTGAGDVFHGGFLYGLLQDWPLRDITRFAAAAAALKCTQLGGRAGIPTRAAVDAFLATQPDRDREAASPGDVPAPSR